MELAARVRGVRMLVSDVDGVLTDGSISYGTGHLEQKVFNIKDGLAMKLAWTCGFPIVWLTGRSSEAVSRRASELDVRVYQGISEKAAGLRQVAQDYGMALEEIAYIGDDLNDLAALEVAGLPLAVADAAPEVLALAQYVTQARGGQGAIREAIEYIFHTQGRWEEGVQAYRQFLAGAGMPPSGRKMVQ